MSVSKTPPVCHQLWGGVETWNYDFRGDLVWKFQSLAKFPTVFPYQDLEVQLKHSVSDGWNPALASFQRLKLSTNGAVGIRATSGLETQSFFKKKNIKEREREALKKLVNSPSPPTKKKMLFWGAALPHRCHRQALWWIPCSGVDFSVHIHCASTWQVLNFRSCDVVTCHLPLGKRQFVFRIGIMRC